MEYINDAIKLFFIGWLDTMAYGLLGVAYNIFYAVARLNLFGGNAAGQAIYDGITSRFYNILSIVMVFIFAYQLIMLIIDPDGKDNKAAGSILKDTLVSVVFIIVLPTLFKYMAIFQNHIIENNTIGAMILGTNGANTDTNPGKSISLMVFTSFYHPTNTTYSTFFDESGQILSTAEDDCIELAGTGSDSICKNYVEALTQWKNDNSYGIGTITGVDSLRHSVGFINKEGKNMDYQIILCTGAGLVTAWFFFAYAIALGTRAVKLGVLQLIAPIPLVFRIFSHTRKTFETWFGEIRKAYLELFIRLGIIFFIVYLIQQVPSFIKVIFEANQNAGDGLTKCIATVCLILGMLQFAKDAPDLFKTLFSNGGNLFSGLNFSPKIRSHVENNPYGMKAIGAATGALGGIAGAVVKRARDSYMAGGGKFTGSSRPVVSGIAGATAAPRGLLSGAIKGFKNAPTKLTRKGITEGLSSGASAAQTSLDNRAFLDTRKNIANAFSEDLSRKGLGQVAKDFGKTQWGLMTDSAGQFVAKEKEKFGNFVGTLTGEHRDFTRASTAAKTLVDGAEGIIETAEGNKALDTRKTNIRTKTDNGEISVGADGKSYQKMYNKEKDVIARSNVIDTQLLADGDKQITTSDGFKYTIDKNGDVVSRSKNVAEAIAIQAKQAAKKGQTISIDGKTYDSLDDKVNTIVSDTKTRNDKGMNSNGQSVYEITTNTGETFVEKVSTDGTKTITSSDGKVTYNIDASGKVQSKEQKVIVNGVQETRVVENVQNLIVAKESEARANKTETIYNVEQQIKEIDQEKSNNITKALRNNEEARRTYAKTMLDSLQENVGSFSSSYSGDVENDFIKKFGGETIEEFLKRMSDPRTTSAAIKDDDGKKFEAIKKIMNKEVTRSKANADAEAKAREAAEAKQKKDDKK